jgi:hypothetical protein
MQTGCSQHPQQSQLGSAPGEPSRRGRVSELGSPGKAASGTRGRRLISLPSVYNYSHSLSAVDSRGGVICRSVKLIRNLSVPESILSRSSVQSCCPGLQINVGLNYSRIIWEPLTVWGFLLLPVSLFPDMFTAHYPGNSSICSLQVSP